MRESLSPVRLLSNSLSYLLTSRGAERERIFLGSARACLSLDRRGTVAAAPRSNVVSTTTIEVIWNPKLTTSPDPKTYEPHKQGC